MIILQIKKLCTISLILVVTIIMLPIQIVSFYSNLHLQNTIPRIYHKIILKILGIRINLIGSIADEPGLFISNHASWIDIFLLSSITDLSFIAKKDVATWPVVGFLARLQKTIFIDRANPKTIPVTIKEIEKRILSKEKVVLFAEGTSSDGNRILPFKSSIFMICDLLREKNHTIQPISIAYTRYNGLPMDRKNRPLIAWYGNMNLFNHLMGIIASGSFDVDITFHNIIDISKKKSRKEISIECEKRIRSGFLDSLNRSNS